ncbi:RidA family protein [Falsirhodobacter algicola]|uniref:RidA family protein n=1 Tax=Falsirhodobacter algicola TaxID=2692330 RepID=UPI001BA9404F|nr:RidA family protein [Falsirhodobacter algicola]
MKLISSGSPFEAKMGYSRAVVKGDWCFVSGTTGYGADGVMPEGVADQARNAFATIQKALTEGGFAMSDVVRVQYTLSDAALFDDLLPALAEAFAEIRPAATMVIADLIRPEMLIEIEVTALKG